jgi:hypothetical protein
MHYRQTIKMAANSQPKGLGSFLENLEIKG